MANDYYSNADAAGRFLAGETASGADVDNKFDAVEAGFELLPSPPSLYQGRVNFAVDTGSVDSYQVALGVPPSSYVVGMQVRFIAATTNTGPASLNVNGLGVQSISRQDGTALRAADIPAGSVVTVTHDGARFMLDSAAAGAVTAAEAARDAAQDAQTLAQAAQGLAEAAQSAVAISESNASSSAGDALVSEQNAAASAALAARWAVEAEDVEVTTGAYSAYHWAQKALQYSGSDIDATAIGFLPAGGIAATNVQAAIQELDAEKATAAQGALADTAVQPGDGVSLLVNDEGYLTAATEADPTVGSHIKAITSGQISSWNAAASWGNHAAQGYLTSVSWAGVAGKPTVFPPRPHSHSTVDLSHQVTIITTNATASVGRLHVIVANSALTLPASPAQGSWVGVSKRNGAADVTIVRNGQRIMGLLEDMVLDIENFSGGFVFVDATRGWVMV